MGEVEGQLSDVESYLALSDDDLDALSAEAFELAQRQLLLVEREHYVEQASQLKAEAESLTLAGEAAEVQFDEESGEGGTTTVDRERDLVLAASALAAIEEVDVALNKVGRHVYGICEIGKEEIPRARLRALPYARLCVRCKEGGLPRRR
ncbi:MAG: TraR/DksA family transcriptional regulator [Ferrimicrobium sp.]